MDESQPEYRETSTTLTSSRIPDAATVREDHWRGLRSMCDAGKHILQSTTDTSVPAREYDFFHPRLSV